MSLNSIIFIDSLPKLDLHGMDSASSRLYIKEFINDNIIMKNEYIAIIHGIGSGILKKTTHEELKKNKNVLDFKTYYHNHGSTIVQLKLK